VIDEAVLREVLPGRWRVLASTFPMWLSGRRLHPTFSYGLLPGPRLTLSDEVSYRTRAGRERRIAGVDRFDGETFTWRGRGVLGVLTSRWRIVHLSDDRQLIVLAFEKSLVTPAGMDVIGRAAAGRPAAPPDLTGADRAQYDALHWLG
jgi:hypothetical protein